MPSLARGCMSEFLGTFALVFFGAGSIIAVNQPIAAVGGGNLVAVALAHGVILAIMITACMYVSGAQFNPAVSLGVFIAGKQSAVQTVSFIITQCFAAICAAGMLVFLLTPDIANNPEHGTNVGATIGWLTERGNKNGVIGFEAIATFALMWAVLAGTVDGRAHKLGGFVIGLTVTACILAIGPLTGASMNPARTLGPAVYGHWDMFWVYMLAPSLGACLAAFIYRWVWAEKTPA